MTQWKRTARNAGLSLTVMAGGALAAEGIASAHDGARWVLQGTVTSVGANSFAITNHKGTTETIDTTSTTTYNEAGTPVAPTGVTLGEDVAVALAPVANSSPATPPTAVHVTVLLDRVSGKVTDVTSASITLSGPRGLTREAIISSSTAYYKDKTTVSGVTDGEFVTVFGTRDTTTPPAELTALFVDIGSTAPSPPKGPSLVPTGPDPHSVVPPGRTTGTLPSLPTAPSGSATGFHGKGPGNGSFPGGFSAGAGQGGHGFAGGGKGSGSPGGRG